MAPLLNLNPPRLQQNLDFIENVILSGILVCMLIMTLKFKFKWFRARLKFNNPPDNTPAIVTGVYRQSIDPELFTSNNNPRPELYKTVPPKEPTKTKKVSKIDSFLESNPFDDVISELTTRQSDNEPDYINELPTTKTYEAEYLTLTDEKENQYSIESVAVNPKYQEATKKNSTKLEIDDYEVASVSKYDKLATKRNSDFMVNRQDLPDVEQNYSSTATSIFLRNKQTQRKKTTEFPRRGSKSAIAEQLSRPLMLSSSDFDNLSISSQTSA